MTILSSLHASKSSGLTYELDLTLSLKHTWYIYYLQSQLLYIHNINTNQLSCDYTTSYLNITNHQMLTPSHPTPTHSHSPLQTSPLLRLPAELRLQIYKYILSGETFSIHAWRRYTPFSIATRILRKRRNFLALLAVNHQLHAETHLLPFQHNVFRFKSQDAFGSWLAGLSAAQQDAVREIQIVTWMARHMVEGEAWQFKALEDVVPVGKLKGLRRVWVEVRMNGRAKECVRGDCFDCEDYGAEVRIEERRVREWLVGRCGVDVRFERVAA